jgi:hypothetical protein
MSLHSFFISAFYSERQRWRGSGLLMHLHQKRPIKRAGEAGIALRAGRGDRIYFTRLCALLRGAVLSGRVMRCAGDCVA